MFRFLGLAAAATMLPAICLAEAGVAANTLSQSEAQAGWTLLFDGDDLSNFRGYTTDEVPAGWAADDGLITFTPGPEEVIEKGKNKGKTRNKRLGDLMTREQYGAFELSLEYRISEGGNSGLMFHVVEQEGKPPWHSGPEIQIQDNVAGHDPQKAGWLYQLYQPPNSVPILKDGLPGQEGQPLDATRPTSFRPRSSSMRCSARSFGSASSDCSAALSSSLVAPRGRVPAIGLTVTSPSRTLTRISGLEPTTAKPGRSRK